MKTISLLPPESKLSLRLARMRIVLLMAGAALLFLFFLFNGFVMLAAQRIESRSRLVTGQRALLQQEISSLQEYAQMQERVGAVEELLEECIGTEPDWNALLDSLARVLARETQLMNLSATYEGAEGELHLQGSAPGYHYVTSMMERLVQLDELENVRCLYTAETMGSYDRPAVEFELAATILPGEAGGGRKGVPKVCDTNQF